MNRHFRENVLQWSHEFGLLSRHAATSAFFATISTVIFRRLIARSGIGRRTLEAEQTYDPVLSNRAVNSLSSGQPTGDKNRRQRRRKTAQIRREPGAVRGSGQGRVYFCAQRRFFFLNDVCRIAKWRLCRSIVAGSSGHPCLSQIDDVSACTEEGITALHTAICATQAEVVEFLIKVGADVNAMDADGWTPLHCAASCNNLDFVRMLVEHGAAIFLRTNSDMETALEKCEGEEDTGCAECLYSEFSSCMLLNFHSDALYAEYD